MSDVMCFAAERTESRAPHTRPQPGRFLLLGIPAFAVLLAATATLFSADEPAGTSAKKPAAKKARPPAEEESDAADEKPAADNPLPENPFSRRVKSPDLDGGTGWLNTSGEISLRDLKGKVVLLDFWTFCCINCMHVLPDLKYLEKKFRKELVVIGVHSAKFDNEKESDSIRQAIMRYEIEHPVINDSEMTVWKKFGASAWPSFVLIDPEGYAVLMFSSEIGEEGRGVLENLIEKLVAYHKAKGTLDETPVRFNLEREKAEPTPLRFPGKVLADEAGDRLFISDSNHNRIVIASLNGKLRQTIGTGAIGKDDGAFDKATFHHPQGMALVGETLYVADTENHLLRAIDLQKKIVTTLAGTGKQGSERRFGGELLKTALNSPWDLVHVDGKLYIAMAGPHQLWMLNLKEVAIDPYAGSGAEDIVDGPLEQAAMAQPSGIVTDGKALYVVDSEGSAVRRVPLDPFEKVTTIVGESGPPRGHALFAFGDIDAEGKKARLQHPLGIAYHGGTLYVADSYNHKLKTVDPDSGEAKTYLGDGKPGDRDKPPRFSEPAGLSVARGTLYVADTNNHKIRTVDLKDKAVATLTIEGLTAPVAKPPATAEGAGLKAIALKPQRVAAGDALAFEVTLELPEGYKLNPLLSPTYRLKATAGQSLVAADLLGPRHEIDPPEKGTTVKFRVPLSAKAGKAELQVTLTYGYCRDGKGGLCKLGTLSWAVPIEVTGDAKDRIIRLPVEVE